MYPASHSQKSGLRTRTYKPECCPLRLGSPLISVMSSLEAIMLPSWLFCGVTAFSSTVLLFKLMIVVGISVSLAQGSSTGYQMTNREPCSRWADESSNVWQPRVGSQQRR